MKTITIIGTGKKAIADIDTKYEPTVVSLSIYHENGSESHYGKKQCQKHEYRLYNLVKNYLYAY